MVARILALAFAAGAIMAAPAFAATDVWFVAQDGAPDLLAATTDDEEVAVAISVVRGGSTIVESELGFVELDLQPGDVVSLSAEGAALGSVTYDGLPAIPGPVCVGHATFAARRAPGATVVMAGAGSMQPAAPEPSAATWTAGETLTVTLPGAIAADDGAFVATTQPVGGVNVLSMRMVTAAACPPGTPPPPPPGAPPRTPEAPSIVADLQPALASALVRLRKTGLKALARRTSKAVTIAFPEAGRLELRLTAKGKLVGTARTTLDRSRTSRVTLRLTSAGRRLLARSPKLKVTLRGTFTPAAPGGVVQRESTSLTLRR